MKHMRRQNAFVNKFADLENYYVDSLLKGELNQLYKGVQLNCSDFRQNVFSKNLELLDSKLVSKVVINILESLKTWSLSFI